MRILYVGPQIDSNAQLDSALAHVDKGEHVVFHAHSYNIDCPNTLAAQEATSHVCWNSSDLLKRNDTNDS
jgi:hypothetical protein